MPDRDSHWAGWRGNSDDPNENRAVKNIVKRIRDVSLAIGVPVIVVAHLRKKDRIPRPLAPDLDDFHGASDITKIAIALAEQRHREGRQTQRRTNESHQSRPQHRTARTSKRRLCRRQGS